ncbi:MAG: hypothetical protein JWP63_712 [Candidatus Solibacter sp.]|jgi:hypothetical protein|nr:hypothetical protein [Candidatus Solibacter sp.]
MSTGWYWSPVRLDAAARLHISGKKELAIVVPSQSKGAVLDHETYCTSRRISRGKTLLIFEPTSDL